MTSPTLIVTQNFTHADASLADARTIYDSGIAHLRQALLDFVAGRDNGERVRACYPFAKGVHRDRGAGRLAAVLRLRGRPWRV